MTTILADLKAGVMVSDSVASDGDRVWPNHRKVWRVGGALVGFAGLVEDAALFLRWLQDGQQGKPPAFRGSDALIMSSDGLFSCRSSTVIVPCQSGIDAIGTGSQAAMAAYEALGWEDPARAVRIACRHDAGSRAPVRVYKLRAIT